MAIYNPNSNQHSDGSDSEVNYTKPGFVLRRLKLLFHSDNELEKQKVFQMYIDKRNKQKEKMCYCGHSIDCDCSNPDINVFEHNLLNNNIEEKDLL